LADFAQATQGLGLGLNPSDLLNIAAFFQDQRHGVGPKRSFSWDFEVKRNAFI
jgi:hypothetical protein